MCLLDYHFNDSFLIGRRIFVVGFQERMMNMSAPKVKYFFLALIFSVHPIVMAQAPQPPPMPLGIFSVQSGTLSLERNKTTVVAFYDLMFNQAKPAQAVQLYVGKTYIQHNPHVADGKQAFIDFFEKMAKEHPGKEVRFKRVFAEGAFVTLHSEHWFPGWRGGSWAAIDIFRLDEDGHIIEHWDALQKVPDKSANANSMF